MKNIELLKQEKEKLSVKLRRVISEIDRINESEVIPSLKDRYLGKCFKYQNSYGSGSGKWWLYLQVTEIKDATWFGSIQFQTDCNGRFDFEYGNTFCLSDGYIPITEKEFYSRYQIAINKLNSVVESNKQ